MITGSRDCVLIFRLGSIGDTVVALPCFHAIARAYPNHRRILLTDSLTSSRASSAETVLTGTGLIDEAIYYPVGDFSFMTVVALIRTLRQLHPVRMIYLAERSASTSVYRDLLFFKAAGIPSIVGVPWKKALRQCMIDPKTRELEHESERLTRVLNSAIPVNLLPPSWDLRLSTFELAKAAAVLREIAGTHPLVAIAPGAKITAKDWGSENWSAMLQLLAVRYGHCALVIVGAPDERTLGEEVSRGWIGPVANLCGRLTPREAAAVLRSCRLLICHDSGPMHLAASQLTPCVALFGNRNRPRQWFPFGDGHRVIYEPGGVRSITVQRVVAEVRSVLDSQPDCQMATSPC